MLLGPKNGVNPTQALGLMIILVMAFAMLSGDYRRAVARPMSEARPSAPTSIPLQLGSTHAYPNGNNRAGGQNGLSYGLIQSGMVGVSQLTPTGQFGPPTAMPVYQIIRLHAPRRTAMIQPVPSHAGVPGSNSSAAASPLQRSQPEQSMPPGIMVAPPAAVAPQALVAPQTPVATAMTTCKVNNIDVLTASATACASAGGKPVDQK